MKKAPILWALAVLCTMVFSVGVTVSYLHGVVTENREWIKETPVPRASSLAGDLLQERLLPSGIVWVERSSERTVIRVADCTTYAVEVPRNAKVFGGVAGDRASDVRELCLTPSGDRIRDQIAIFNSSNNLVAIRDNRGNFTTTEDYIVCSSGTLNSKLFVPPGCLKEEWTVSVGSTGQSIGEVSSMSIPLVEFAYLADPTRPLMSDWSVARPFVSPSDGRSPAHRLETQLTLGPSRWEADLIGEVKDITVGSARVVVTDGILPLRNVIANGVALQIEISRVCPNDYGAPFICGAADAAKKRSASRIRISGPSGTVIRLQLNVLPSNVADVPRQQIDGLETLPAYERHVRNLSLTCKALTVPAGSKLEELAFKDVNNHCLISWNRIEPNRDGDNDSADLDKSALMALTQNGIKLIDEEGTLTNDAFDLGYVDVLGFGIEDSGSYASYLAEKTPPAGVKLTLIPAYQSVLQNILEKHRHNGIHKGREARRDFVLIDAEGKDAGAILGFASLPRASVGLSHWDLLSLDTVHPGLSPFASHTWKVHGVEATPGSTFKLVTSLAAIQHVLNNPGSPLEDILLGEASPKQTSQTLKTAKVRWVDDPRTSVIEKQCTIDILNPAADLANGLPIYKYDGSGTVIYCMKNYIANKGLGQHRERGNGKCRPGDARAHIGMCEALAHSSNLFFAGLEVAMEGHRLLGPGQQSEHDQTVVDFELAQIADRLLNNAPAKSRAFEAPDPGMAVLRMVSDPIKLAVTNKANPNFRRTRMFELAQAGIGQSVDATPLAMATVAASIAMEKVVYPHFLAMDDRDAHLASSLIDVPPGEDMRYRALWEQLRRGMNGVVNWGTGMGGFSADLKGAAFAKTGTATLGDTINKKPIIGAWMVGFVEPPAGSGIPQRIAFACRVAPILSGGGGKTCGPIVRDVFDELNGISP